MKGRPILGVISGFLFGLFLSLTLFLYGVLPLASDWLWILPLLGILLGLILAAWAPFGRGAEPAPAPASAEPITASSGSAPAPADVTDAGTPPEPTEEGEVEPASAQPGVSEPEDEQTGG